MKENKNIDRLFQEKLKDFEAIPDAQTWNNFSKLHSKERIVLLFQYGFAMRNQPCLFWAFYYLKIKV
jgi:hypothetical protein